MRASEEYLDKARLNNRTNPVILADLGYLLTIGETPDIARAVDCLEQAYTLSIGSPYEGVRNEVAVGLALALIGKGDYERARELLRATIQQYSNKAPADVVKTFESLDDLLTSS